jgi:uncharacterized protein DUF6916
VIARDAFGGQVGSAFRVVGGACDSVELRLAELTDGKAAPGYELFSLFFHGPAAPRLDQATYTMVHPALGTVALFLVPVGALPGGIRYEALFNRRRAEP